MLLALLVLLAGPVMPASALSPSGIEAGGGCVEMATGSPAATKATQGGAAKSLCADTCGVACQLIVAPASTVSPPAPHRIATAGPRLARPLWGRNIAPDPPRPR